MEYVCVDARFKFFNGQKNFTIHFSYGLSTWYVFNEQETTGALWWKEIKPEYQRSPNRDNAGDILEEYLNKNSHVHPVFKDILDKIK